ncbi:MAG TPA: hypothetical protein VFH68_18875 [Polyangia bacterium]|jgi:hypothetical protein|nr:hypothetical protein [Polyangia bacterium]
MASRLLARVSTNGAGGKPTRAAGARHAVVVELAHDWARREVLREWSQWLRGPSPRSPRAAPAPVRRGRAGLVNDILCLRWLGHLDDRAGGCAAPADRIAKREAHDVAAWSFLAIVGDGHGLGAGGGDPTHGGASDLVEQLTRWGRTSTLSIEADGTVETLPGKKGPRRWPPIVRCLAESALAHAWLLGGASESIHDQIARLATVRMEIEPPVHLVSDIRRARGAGEADIAGRSQIWRAYRWPRPDRRAEIGASAALVDGLRTIFDVAGVELALVKPLAADLAVEIAGAVLPSPVDRRKRAFDAFERADQVALDLGYAIPRPLRRASDLGLPSLPTPAPKPVEIEVAS